MYLELRIEIYIRTSFPKFINIINENSLQTTGMFLHRFHVSSTSSLYLSPNHVSTRTKSLREGNYLTVVVNMKILKEKNLK